MGTYLNIVQDAVKQFDILFSYEEIHHRHPVIDMLPISILPEIEAVITAAFFGLASITVITLEIDLIIYVWKHIGT